MAEETKPKRASSGNSGIAKAAKQRRREEAEARQAIYDKIPIDQKIAKATPGSKEHKKLLILKGPHT